MAAENSAWLNDLTRNPISKQSLADYLAIIIHDDV